MSAIDVDQRRVPKGVLEQQRLVERLAGGPQEEHERDHKLRQHQQVAVVAFRAAFEAIAQALHQGRIVIIFCHKAKFKRVLTELQEKFIMVI